MKHCPANILLLVISFAVISPTIHAQEEVEIWNAFVASLKSGNFSAEQIRPHAESLREPLLGFLNQIREKALWEEFEKLPEIIQLENQINYLIPLTFDGHTGTYCFTFIREDNSWFFKHLEYIFIRMDKLAELPTSTLPDMLEENKAWVREEIYWSMLINNFYNVLIQDYDKEYVMGMFKDGGGYFVGAKTWIPFIPPHRAFILYLCWEQANLRGNPVILEKLDDHEAVIKIEPMYFRLYTQSAHMKQIISFEDYNKIFETIWQDRAKHTGWQLKIEWDKNICIFNFRRD